MPTGLSTLDDLRRRVARLERAAAPSARPLTTGVAVLDRLLPAGGLWPGTLVEYLSAGGGDGAGSLALAAARQACHTGRALVVVDRQRTFSPPAAAGWQIDVTRVVVVRPVSAADQLWAVDQALRSPGVGAVWVRLPPLDTRDFRRLQLAAEEGRSLGVLLRPASVRGWPAWSDVQWLVEPQPARESWRLRVELLRCRGGAGGRAAILELDETTGTWRGAHDGPATHPVPALAELAHPAPPRRQSSA